MKLDSLLSSSFRTKSKNKQRIGKVSGVHSVVRRWRSKSRLCKCRNAADLETTSDQGAGYHLSSPVVPSAQTPRYSSQSLRNHGSNTSSSADSCNENSLISNTSLTCSSRKLKKNRAQALLRFGLKRRSSEEVNRSRNFSDSHLCKQPTTATPHLKNCSQPSWGSIDIIHDFSDAGSGEDSSSVFSVEYLVDHLTIDEPTWWHSSGQPVASISSTKACEAASPVSSSIPC